MIRCFWAWAWSGLEQEKEAARLQKEEEEAERLSALTPEPELQGVDKFGGEVNPLGLDRKVCAAPH